jgi:hypothetical protein
MPHPGRQPRIDERVATPETREEYIDGRVVHALPASPEHADMQAGLARVLGTSTAPGYVTSVEMLTRTSANWDFAADVSIRKRGPDPETGTRHLEELAFEVKNTQSMSDLTRRAEQLAGRGVRRVFVICVRPGEEVDEIKAGPVLEWSQEQHEWVELGEDAVIEDACLHGPLPVRALIDAAEGDDTMARTLLDKGNPVLREHEKQVYDRALADGLREVRAGILDLCEALDIEVTPGHLAELERMKMGELGALRNALKTRRAWPVWRVL